MVTSPRTANARQIFEQVLDAAVEDRVEVLHDACGDDHLLLSEVESLLQHHRSASADFMKPPRSPIEWNSITRSGPSLIGETVGQYRIVSLIKEGGMGVVYRAEQLSLQREVAIKFIRSGFTQAIAQRFEHETRILSSLRHRHVAQVHDAGIYETAGHPMPYFVMELIPNAQPITAYALERDLDLRARIELFIQVCEGVEFGHRKGVIHRDLKPSNILVDAQGEVKIIDFGVARSVDSDVAATTIQTQVGELVGTLQYMSPEQCDANPNELDTRTDVYSLGVVLYELLTGDLPYKIDGTSIFRATQTIKTHAPRPVSQFRRELRGDVEVIVQKALEKSPDRRYGSVIELREDLARFLRREPIAARKPTAWARLVRWSIRHPLGATSVACLATIAATIASSLVIVHWLKNRPFRLLVAPDQRTVQLWTISGSPLGNPLSVRAGESIFALPELIKHKGRLLGVIGFPSSYYGPYAGKLCAFDTRSGDLSKATLEWSDALVQKDIPNPEAIPPPTIMRSYVPQNFAVAHVWSYDVFDQTPGPEIIADFRQQYSLHCIRIYDCDGVPQFQFWHDGTVVACYWMKDHRLLMLGGRDSTLTNLGSDELDSDVADSDLPLVFAIQPRFGHLSTRVINANTHRQRDVRDDTGLVWYETVFPPSIGQELEVRSILPPAEVPTDKRNDYATALLQIKQTNRLSIGVPVHHTGVVDYKLINPGDPLKDADRKSDEFSADALRCITLQPVPLCPVADLAGGKPSDDHARMTAEND